ncbi:MAG: winged helix-turn-helix domain-containing protein [Pirellulaceae bacterium]|nr:winged helix-turn-helix domain-containing protein [Pirellulaceae bacterium]
MAANHEIELGDTMMKKADVKIGGVYGATVSGKRVEVRIDGERPRGGWDATNLLTNKKMQIKSGQRLQPVAGSKRAAKSKGDGKATEVASEPAVVDPVVAEAGVLKKPRKGKATKDKTVDTSEKRLSCVSAALKVLAESEQPLNTKEMIEAMLAKGYWSSPGGKTPHATLYSAILRDLAAGDAARFVKIERGRFAART